MKEELNFIWITGMIETVYCNFFLYSLQDWIWNTLSLHEMEKFELHILGCGSALPTTRHFATSQVVNLREKLFMIDCGEGAQMQLRRSRLKFSRLNHIFISHLHGDHCFGLLGLISTFGLLGRTADLHIHSPIQRFTKYSEDDEKPRLIIFVICNIHKNNCGKSCNFCENIV